MSGIENSVSERFDPYISVCPECGQDDIRVANGRARTHYCPNCDIRMGWSQVVRMRRSRYRDTGSKQEARR